MLGQSTIRACLKCPASFRNELVGEATNQHLRDLPRPAVATETLYGLKHDSGCYGAERRGTHGIPWPEEEPGQHSRKFLAEFTFERGSECASARSVPASAALCLHMSCGFRDRFVNRRVV